MGIRWGFQWGKVVSGGLTFVIGGGICLGLWIVGIIHFWAVGITMVGLLTMLSGLIGDEGIW
jgi:hypothetical protein